MLVYHDWLHHPHPSTFTDDAWGYSYTTVGGSIGNDVWSFGAGWLLAPTVTRSAIFENDATKGARLTVRNGNEGTDKCQNIALGDCRYRIRNYDESAKEKGGVIFFAMGPFLAVVPRETPKKGWGDRIDKMINEDGAKFLGYGLGLDLNAGFMSEYTDLPQNADEAKSRSPPGNLETAGQVQLNENSKYFLDVLERNGFPYGVRGDYTAAAIKANGGTHAISMGCPSLFINARPDLGQVLGNKYKDLVKKASLPGFKIAFNIHQNAVRGPRFNKLIIEMIKQLPGSFIICQDPHHYEKIKRFVKEEHGIDVFEKLFRRYADINVWYEDLRTVDLQIGAKIHGHMLSVAAETPALLLPPDWRIQEMVDKMELAHTSLTNGPITAESTLEHIVSVASAAFDADAFTKSRAEKACLYKQMFASVGLDLREEVASLCPSDKGHE